MKTCWILTQEFNAYDQYGEYFLKVFKEKPTFQQLLPIIVEQGDFTGITPEHVVGNLIRKGGDRIKSEDKWFFLKETEML